MYCLICSCLVQPAWRWYFPKVPIWKETKISVLLSVPITCFGGNTNTNTKIQILRCKNTYFFCLMSARSLLVQCHSRSKICEFFFNHLLHANNCVSSQWHLTGTSWGQIHKPCTWEWSTKSENYKKKTWKEKAFRSWKDRLNNEQGLHKINGGLLILPAFPHVSLNSRKNTKIETYIWQKNDKKWDATNILHFCCIFRRLDLSLVKVLMSVN